MSEYEFSISESLWPVMLAEIVEERKRKINCKILQVQSGESNTPHPFLYEEMAMIRMATSTSFPRRIFPVASPRSVLNTAIQRRPFAWQRRVPKAPISRRLAWQCSQSVQKHLKSNHHNGHELGVRFTRKNMAYPTPIAMLWATPSRSRPTSKIKWHSALRGRTILFK